MPRGMEGRLGCLPNTVIKLVHALSYLGAAQKINTDFFESNLTEINALAKECGHKHSTAVASIHNAKETINKQFEALDISVSAIDALLKMVLPERDILYNTKVMIDRANVLVNTCFGKASDRLRIVNGLMVIVSEKLDQVSLLQNPFFRESKRNRMEHEYKSKREPRSILQVPQVTDLLRCRDVPPDTFDNLLAELARDLRTAKNILEDSKWDDDEVRESSTIMTTLSHAWASRSTGENRLASNDY